MSGQKTLAVIKTRRRRLYVDYCPRYWAVGVAFGHANYHVQLGPLSLGVTKLHKL
ncbi:hypothetical protein LLE49_01455 [Alicyclobacillus tolerans]|uniref:hypothetical protein n=1 Tax=Alicyclobacillus tolerans TaxID=90970 RepID=UPI001F3F1CD9|nr:hypothetical protein [Alicyclobacillus tolerans]MCF8563411.1 hypothetical protein [Alicyclobacillus tolerans]